MAPIVAKIGTTITLDGLAVTLQSATTIPGDQEAQPLPGNTFVVVHLMARSAGTAPKECLCLDFPVIRGARTFNTPQEVAPAPYTGARNLYDAPDRLLPGDSVEGDLTIQGPTDDHLAELTWDPFFSSEVGAYGWNLGL